MKVKFLRTMRHAPSGVDIEEFKKGDVSDLCEKTAKIWIGARIVEPVNEMKKEVKKETKKTSDSKKFPKLSKDT